MLILKCDFRLIYTCIFIHMYVYRYMKKGRNKTEEEGKKLRKTVSPWCFSWALQAQG